MSSENRRIISILSKNSFIIQQSKKISKTKVREEIIRLLKEMPSNEEVSTIIVDEDHEDDS